MYAGTLCPHPDSLPQSLQDPYYIYIDPTGADSLGSYNGACLGNIILNENLNAKTDQMIPNPMLKQVILLLAFNVVSESNNNLKTK